MQSEESQSPNSVPWPPLILVFALVGSGLLGFIEPLPGIDARWVRAAGYALISVGVALDVWAILTMRKAKTNILPHRPADRLVVTGPFRFTRNPIYLGNVTLMVGIGVAFDDLWFVILGVVSAFFVDWLAIRREERHLAVRFGKKWTDYASQVPRWVVRFKSVRV